jgi:hypothetical protein
MTATNIDAVAYLNGDSTVAIYGRNTGGATNSTVTLTMPNPPAYLTPRITTATTTDVVGPPVPLTNGQGTFALPGSSVFTLLSSPGSGSGGTGGSGGQGGMSSGGNAGSGGLSAGNGGVSGDGTAGASSGAPSGGQSGSSAGGQSGAGGAGGAASGAGGQSSGGAGQGGAGTSSGGAGAGGAAAGMASASGSGGGLPALIAGWAFNEGSGTTTTDASGHGHTGTINGATWTTTGCKYGSCLSFTGTGHNVTTPDAADLDLGTAFTIMAWVKPTTTAGWRPVLIKENGTNLEAYLLYSDPVTQGGVLHRLWQRREERARRQPREHERVDRRSAPLEALPSTAPPTATGATNDGAALPLLRLLERARSPPGRARRQSPDPGSRTMRRGP